MVDLTYNVGPNFNDLYALPTNTLRDYLNSWLEDVVDIKPLRTSSDDSYWFMAAEYPDPEKLCEITKIQVATIYVNGYR